MKLECNNCGNIYEHNLGACPKCKNRGGYLQLPNRKIFPGMTIHLNDTILHKKSSNSYKVKEIQKNGIIAIICDSPLPQVINKPAYISNALIGEYTLK